MLKQSKLESWICRIAGFLVRGAVCVGLCGMLMARANANSHALDFHFFHYAKLDLPGTNQPGRNLDGSLTEAQVSGGGGTATETVNTEVSPGAQHGVAGFDTIAQLNDKTATTLADILGPVTNSCWTLEWDNLIGAKGSFVVSQVIALTPILVPEPSALAFIVLGLVACWGICRLTRRA